MSRSGLAFVCLLAAASQPAFAVHNVPGRATQIDVTLVRAFPDCVLPSATSAFLNGTPACVGVTEPDPCRFLANGKGVLKGKRYPTNAISPADLHVRAKLQGLSPECEGRTLALAVEASVTVDDCGSASCTVALLEAIVGTCTPTRGTCNLLASVNQALAGGVIVGGRKTSIAIRRARIVREDRTPLFEAGVQLP